MQFCDLFLSAVCAEKVSKSSRLLVCDRVGLDALLRSADSLAAMAKEHSDTTVASELNRVMQLLLVLCCDPSRGIAFKSNPLPTAAGRPAIRNGVLRTFLGKLNPRDNAHHKSLVIAMLTTLPELIEVQFEFTNACTQI